MKNKKVFGIISLIFCTLSFIIGLIILPFVTNIGLIVLQYILAALILSYVFFVLLYKAINRNGINQILAIIEMVLDIVISLMLILNFKLEFIMFNELYYVIMLVLLIHSLFSVISGYYIIRKNTKGYPLYFLLLDICLIVFSILGFNYPILDNNQLIIITSCFCFIGSISSLIFGIVMLRKKVNKS